jgi:hypothetical protein
MFILVVEGGTGFRYWKGLGRSCFLSEKMILLSLSSTPQAPKVAWLTFG